MVTTAATTAVVAEERPSLTIALTHMSPTAASSADHGHREWNLPHVHLLPCASCVQSPNPAEYPRDRHRQPDPAKRNASSRTGPSVFRATYTAPCNRNKPQVASPPSSV